MSTELWPVQSGSLAAANWRISIGNLCVSPNQLRKLLRLFNGRRIYPRQMPQHLPERYGIVRGRQSVPSSPGTVRPKHLFLNVDDTRRRTIGFAAGAVRGREGASDPRGLGRRRRWADDPARGTVAMGKAAEETFYCVELTAFFCVGSEIIRNCLHWFPTKQNCPRRRTESLRRRSQNVCDEQYRQNRKD